MRRFFLCCDCSDNDFNPRTHEECDFAKLSSARLLQIFQSTHSRGVRLRFDVPAVRVHKFQSTHSRGVRRLATCQHEANLNFNPRTHEECDKAGVDFKIKKQQFQSTHSRGVRRAWIIKLAAKLAISIHALTRSAT